MPGIYGSKIPSLWIKSAVEKKTCVDILLIGDSNIGYKDVGDTHGGWTSGISYGLANTGESNNMFGTAVLPINTSPDDGPSYGYKYSNLSALAPTTGIDTNSSSSSYGGIPSSVLSDWGRWHLNSQRNGVWYLPIDSTAPITTYQSYNDGWNIDSDCPIGYDSELRHRLVVARFGNGACALNVSLAYGQSPYTELTATNKTLALTASLNRYDLYTHITVAAAATRNQSLAPLQWRRAHPSYGVGIAGPIALLWSSVSRPGYGWSVSPWIHRGGATLEQAIDGIVNGPIDELDAYLNEICSRQVASSGHSPRIIIALNAGANGGDSSISGNTFDSHLNTLHRAVIASLGRLGYGKQNVAYILLPSHPMTSDDLAAGGEPAMVAVRNSARNKAIQLNEMNTALVDLSIVAPYSFIDGSNYHNNPGAGDREHLTQDGYLQVGSRIISNLLEYAMPTQATVNPTTTVTTYGPATRGDRADANTYMFTAIGSSGTASLPKIESFPATFAVTSSGSSNQPCGFVHATSASVLVLSGATASLSTTPGANVLVPSISSGVITFTANATFTSRDVFVTRIA